MNTDKIKIKEYNPFLACEADGRSIFGRTVVTKIRKRDMTQNELRLKAGVPASTLSRIINGKRMPSWSFINSIARALDTTAIELLAYDIPYERLASIVNDNIARYTLPQQEALLSSIKKRQKNGTKL